MGQDLDLGAFVLANGVLQNGQWTYTCPVGTAGTRPASGDNSNTQYANLGLRALRASGIELPVALWETIDGFWRGSQHPDGAWGYTAGGRDSTIEDHAALCQGIDLGADIALESIDPQMIRAQGIDGNQQDIGRHSAFGSAAGQQTHGNEEAGQEPALRDRRRPGWRITDLWRVEPARE